MTPKTAKTDRLGDNAGKFHQQPSPSQDPKGPGRTELKSPPFSHPPGERAWQRSACRLTQQRPLCPALLPPPPTRGRAALHQGHANHRRPHTRRPQTKPRRCTPQVSAAPLQVHNTDRSNHTDNHTHQRTQQGGHKTARRGPRKAGVTATPPAMAAQVPVSEPDATRAEFPTLAAFKRSPRAQCRAKTTGLATQRRAPMKLRPKARNRRSLRPLRLLPHAPARNPHGPGPPRKPCTQNPTTTRHGTLPRPAPLRPGTGKSCHPHPPGRRTRETCPAWRKYGGHTASITARPCAT